MKNMSWEFAILGGFAFGSGALMIGYNIISTTIVILGSILMIAGIGLILISLKLDKLKNKKTVKSIDLAIELGRDSERSIQGFLAYLKESTACNGCVFLNWSYDSVVGIVCGCDNPASECYQKTHRGNGCKEKLMEEQPDAE